MPQPRIVVCISRPGTRFSHGARPLNISSDSRVRNRISPIQMKSGSAASSQDALAFQNAVKRFFAGMPAGRFVNTAMPIQPTIASVIAIQTPPASSTSMIRIRMPPISISSSNYMSSVKSPFA